MRPYDPSCKTYAKDMNHLDAYLNPGQSREDYVKNEEGTYNRSNGHFLCDDCYIKIGCPSSPTGWVCP